MLQKKWRGRETVEVTFRMPPLDDVVELYLCGDFNDWKVKGLPLSLESDGTWVATLVLEAGRTYRYRYHDNQGRWLNDWEADAYVANAFGSDDSVLDLTTPGDASTQPPASQNASKKKPSPPKGARSDSRKTKSGRVSKLRR